MVYILAVALVLSAAAAAAPIQPDVQRLVQEAQEPALQFAPARAGWYGPEVAAGATLAPSLALDASYQARLMRASLLQAAIPDPRVALALGLIILVLRRLRYGPPPGPQLVKRLPEQAPQPGQVRQAA